MRLARAGRSRSPAPVTAGPAPRPIARLARDRSAGVALPFALLLPVLLGLCTLAVDVANLRYNQTQLQLAADAGALAAVSAIANATAAKASGVRLAQLNSPQGTANIAATADVDLGVYNTSTGVFQVSAQAPNAARVRTSRDSQHGNSVPTFFSRAIGLSAGYPVHAAAIAIKGTDYCLYVLDPSASGAVQFSGGVSLTAGCGLQINSSSGSAITTFGVFSVTTSATCIVGGSFNLAFGGFSPSPTTGCPSRPDPLTAIPEPAAVTTCQNNSPIVIGGTLNPGCYTGSITVFGTVMLNPGLYQFQNAKLVMYGNAQLKGDSVTLYFDQKSTFSMVHLSGLDLAAPASGTYQGVVLFFSRAAAGSSLTIYGGTLVNLNGTIYAPATNLTLNGMGSITTKYGYVVVNRLVVTGYGTMSFDAFPSDPRRPAKINSRASLVQ